ncbi:hypothetical protein F4776DRAFT_397146 [Hypoxylon sp. NC0597]|nr:hypothetical protein F4776DRAFT_397146 [Hypoxylon sp. NC0597]
MSQKTEVLISCHCGAAKQTVGLCPPESQATPGRIDIDLCHCHACRHSSGLLCVSYAPIQAPPSLSSLRVYPSESAQSSSRTTLSRYFCNTCGCHVFQHKQTSADGNEEVDEFWAVATGIIIGRARVGNDEEPVGTGDEEEEPLLRNARHVHTADTKDGGLSRFINVDSVEEPRGLENHGLEEAPSPDVSSNPSRDEEGKDVLQAHCYCKNVRFRITRPDASSRLPHSGFPDLMIPFKTSPREVVTNPQNEKWWLCPQGDPNPTRYLAGTCACRSCRLTSGFEIQTWAFVPRSNIFFLPPSSQSSSSPASSNAIPLDFATLPPGILQSYQSSQGVLREFCPRCGATVFWHDRWRPDLIDVSLGLLDTPEGARGERWLEWWYGRVSFEEDADNGRFGGAASWATNLVGSLAQGLKRWGDGKGKRS